MPNHEPTDAAAAVEKPPVDAGCLPAWSVDEMPAPVTMNWRNLLALIGPGIVMIGGTIGSGEWISGSGVARLYGGALLWVAPLAILAQVMLNTEAMRYTLVTGEPMFTGYMRCKPGPRFWLTSYLLFDILTWWPALAGLAAQILIFTLMGSVTDQTQVSLYSSGILIACAVLLCFGGKIYNTLEVVLSGKVLFVLVYLLFVTILFVPASTWGRILGGMVNPFWWPENVEWKYIGAVAGFAGIGGLGNILASNFVREKGWGMGAKVGAIASAFGGQQITLSHIGTMARPTPEAVRRFRGWWKHIQVDQFGLWSIGSVIGMLLPCLLGAEYLQRNYFQDGDSGAQLRAAAGMAQDFGAVHGHVFTILTLLCGFVIFFPGQFSSMDGIARRWCDAVWSGSRRARMAAPDKARHLYYSFIVAYVAVGVALNLFGVSAPKMMVLNANMANFSIMVCILHALYVNTRFLPAEFQPTRAKKVGMILAALFYGGIFALVTSQTVQQAMAGKLQLF